MKDGVNNLSTAANLIMRAADTNLSLTVRDLQRLASRREFDHPSMSPDAEDMYQDIMQLIAHINDARYCVTMLRGKIEDQDS